MASMMCSLLRNPLVNNGNAAHITNNVEVDSLFVPEKQKN